MTICLLLGKTENDKTTAWHISPYQTSCVSIIPSPCLVMRIARRGLSFSLRVLGFRCLCTRHFDSSDHNALQPLVLTRMNHVKIWNLLLEYIAVKVPFDWMLLSLRNSFAMLSISAKALPFIILVERGGILVD